MGDDANQLGQSLRKQRQNADTALKRYMPKPKKIERVLDVFDALIPFSMEFSTTPNEDRVIMTLHFRPPPPARCCANNLCSICETFSDGVEVIQLGRPYIANSVSVFINGIKRTSFTQTSPSTGVVTLTTSVAFGTIVRVCYVYSYT